MANAFFNSRFLRARHVLRLRIYERQLPRLSSPGVLLKKDLLCRCFCNSWSFVYAQPFGLLPFPEQRRQAIAFKNRQPFVQSDQILEHSCNVPKVTTSYSINKNWITNKAIITLNSK